MIQYTELSNIIKRIFSEVKNEGNAQIQVNCPRCRDREGLSDYDGKFNLEINLEKNMFRCWKCDDPKYSGRDITYLIKEHGNKEDLDDFNQIKADYFEYGFGEEEKEEKKESPVTLPDEFIPFSSLDVNNPDHLVAYNYLIFDRKIDRELIFKYRLGFCVEGRYKNRIIIPSFDKNGRINYFVARTWIKGVKPTYMNPKVEKGKFIYNEGYINWDAPVYLVEGGFEELSFPVNTIPLLGKSLNRTLFKVLKEKKPNVIIILDPDAFKENLKLYQEIKILYSDCPERVKFVTLEGNNDLDEIKRFKGKEEVIRQIKKAKEPTDLDLIRASTIIGNNKKKWDWLGVM